MGNLLPANKKQEKPNNIANKVLDENKTIAEELFDDLRNNKELDAIVPDVGIDKSLQTYGGLSSTSVLQVKFAPHLQKELYAEKLKRLGTKIPGAIKYGGVKLGFATPFPLAVGLGALVISMMLENILEIPKNEESSVLMLQRIFATERKRKVRNLMDEYLKRHRLYLHDNSKLKEEIQTKERQLSDQLTSLKNSMKDGHMTSRAFKIWVNGAAFHVQMLIHLLRLEKRDNAPVKSLIYIYKKDLVDLLEKYKEYKTSTIKIDSSTFALVKYTIKNQDGGVKISTAIVLGIKVGILSSVLRALRCYRIRDTETGKEVVAVAAPTAASGSDKSEVVKAFVECFMTRYEPISGLPQYFSDTERHLNELIAECDTVFTLRAKVSANQFWHK